MWGTFPASPWREKKGTIRNHPDAALVDLPGIYSLSPYTNEEIVTRDFLVEQHPDGIINIVDATNIERNLYLTLQLIELNLPMVIALNMMDEIRNNGSSIDVQKLSEEIGVPVVPISASKNEGVDELIRVMLETAEKKQRPKRMDFCSGAVHRAIHALSHMVEDHAERLGFPALRGHQAGGGRRAHDGEAEAFGKRDRHGGPYRKGNGAGAGHRPGGGPGGYALPVH